VCQVIRRFYAIFQKRSDRVFSQYNSLTMTLQIYIDTMKRQQANEVLLAKLFTGEITVPTNKLFKKEIIK
jgi:hypothetical protein